jgi:glycosyltransferase involved in cell wall biosynthesis
MRIGVNTRFLLKDKLEGLGWYTYQTLIRMVKNHPEDEFVFFFDRPYAKEFIFAENVKGVVINPPARHPILWSIWFDWMLPRQIKKHKIDVFYSPDGFLPKNSTAPACMVMHDLAYAHYPDQINTSARKFYEKNVPKYLRKADQIIAVSEATKADIIKQCKILPEKISVAYNGCRPAFIKASTDLNLVRKKISNGKPYFYFIGAIHPRKNVDKIVAAFNLFKKESGLNHQLILAGRMAWQTDAIEKAIKASPYKDEIILPGYLSTDDAVEYMQAAFALVYPSLFEGFGVPVLEALHCEIPVITSNVSSLPEVVGEAGILVDPNSEKDIATAMQKLTNDTALRNQLIENGKIQKNKFSWDKSAETIYSELKKLLKP